MVNQRWDLGHATVDLVTRAVRHRQGTIHSLSSLETKLLHRLALANGEPVSREQLQAAAWETPDPDIRHVDRAIARLRKKVERSARDPEVICTIHGEGYALQLPWMPRPVERITLGGCTVDLQRGCVETNGHTYRLTHLEQKLLLALMDAHGQPLSSDILTRDVWNVRVIGPKTISTTISRLRRKLCPHTVRIHHLPHLGYVLETQRPPVNPLAPLLNTTWAAVDQLSRLVGLEDCVLYARDGHTLVQVAAFGIKSPVQGTIEQPLVLPMGNGIVGTAARSGTAQQVHDTDNDPRYIPDLYSGRSELAVPIFCGAELVGVLDSEDARQGRYQDTERRAFECVAALLGHALSDLQRLL